MMLTTRRNFGRDLFDEMFRDPFFSTGFNRTETSLMKTDIRENDSNYLLDIELPGFHKEDVRAELKDGYLTISAERNDSKEDKDKEGNYLRRERFVGTCTRSFYVGEDVRQEDIHAAFQDGILKLTIPKEVPKTIEEKPNYIPIE